MDVKRADISIVEYGKPIRPETDDELLATVELLFGVTFPRTNVCPNHVAPAKIFCDAYFARTSFMVVFASRGSGKSMLLSTLTLMELLAGMDVVTLGGSAQQSERVLAHMNEAWEHRAVYEWNGQQIEISAPRWAIAKSNTEQTTTIWRNKAVALGASETSVRGEHPQRLNLDEVDAMDLKIYNSAQGMPADKKGFKLATVCSSTRQNLGGTMDYVMDWAVENEFPIYEFCYREQMESNGGFITEDMLARKKKTIPAHMWQIEYENQEPAGREKLFTKSVLDKYFRKGEFGPFDDKIGEEEIFEDVEPDADYVTGVDWGRDKDYTVIETWRYDVFPARLVAWLRVNKQPFPIMVIYLNERWQRYQGKAIHDATGMGKVIMDLIEIPSDNLCHQVIGGSAIRVQLLRDYVTMVENGELESPYIRSMFKEHNTATAEIYRGGEHTPDSVQSGALAAAIMKGTAVNSVKKKPKGRLARIVSWG